jgi:hypothetical protein
VSRYTVNKFMRQVNMTPADLGAYRADAPATVAAFRAAQQAAGQDGLSDAEARALASYDFGALYAMGAHPYLLWSFIEAALVPPMPRPELVQAFRVAAGAVGYPDFATTESPTRR